MNDTRKIPIETTLEYKFSKELIRFVLHDYMTGLHWNPTDIFKENEIESLFTTQFRDAVTKELDDVGPELHRIYDAYFPDKTFVESNHFLVCELYKKRFVKGEFTRKEFISFCVVLAMYAGLSYLYGASYAPYESLVLLIAAIREMKKYGKFDDNTWVEMQNWL